MYHFSAPMTSWKPSEELSEPLRLRAEAPGTGKAFVVAGEVERWYGAACCLVGWNWPVACTAAVVAPGDGGPAFVLIARDVLAAAWFAFCGDGEVVWAYEPGAAAFWMADWARKAARKLEKKGRFDDMVSGDLRRGRGLWRSACIQRRAVGGAGASATVERPLAVFVEACSGRSVVVACRVRVT
jgi:hypothetical protein